MEELGGVAVGAVVFGLFALFFTFAQLTIDSRDGTTVCYEQQEPAGVDQSTEDRVESFTVSFLPLGFWCNWRGADGGTVSAIWPSLVPTFVSTGGLVLIIGGIVILRLNRWPQ